MSPETGPPAPQAPQARPARARGLVAVASAAFPLVLFSAVAASRFIDPAFYVDWVGYPNEASFIELSTLAFLAVTIVLAVIAVRRVDSLAIRAWSGLLAVGCAYFMLEEMSWGQHYWSWETPDWWLNRNVQNETNLHNGVGIIRLIWGTLPRVAMSALLLLTGLALPAWLARAPGGAARTLNRYLPVHPGITAIALVYLVMRVIRATPLEFVVEPAPPISTISEITECFYALFLLYLVAGLLRPAAVPFPLRQRAGRGAVGTLEASRA